MTTFRLEPQWPVAKLREQGLYFNFHDIQAYLEHGRVEVAGFGEMILLGGYSYLGLNRHPRIDDAAIAAIRKYGTGTHGVRLLAGHLELHRELETTLAHFKQTAAAVTFSSGFFANVSTIACLAGRHDTVICDSLDHASIVDGCQLSRAKLLRFRHNDMDHLERCLAKADGNKLVIVDAVFSMDGDIIDLPTVSQLCRRYGATLMVDEAHSIGVLGRTGRGIEEHFGLPADAIDIKMGTLSKAIPAMGGYIAASKPICDFLAHQARGYIYSGALAPAVVAAAKAALEVILDEPDRVARLHDNTRYFAEGLRRLGIDFMASETAIFPILCGDDWQAFHMAKQCWDRGVYVQPIPHPVVPKGKARLRAAVSASHRREELDTCLDTLDRARQALAHELDAVA